MSVEGAVNEFYSWLEQRNAEYERRLGLTYSEHDRLIVKTEATELHVIQAKFEQLVRSCTHDAENTLPPGLATLLQEA